MRISSELIRTQSCLHLPGQCFRHTLIGGKWMLGFAQHTQMPSVALSLVCAPFLPVRWKQSLRNTVKRPLWIRKLHLWPKHFMQTVLRPLLGQPRDASRSRADECRPSTCYDSLVFWHPDSSQESWWEKHKSLCWRHSHPIGCNTLGEWETRWDSWGRGMRLLQQGALVHENKHWPHTNQCFSEMQQRIGSPGIYSERCVCVCVWPRCQL